MPRYIAYDSRKIEYTTYTISESNVNIHHWLDRNVGPMSSDTVWGTSLYVRYGEGWRMITQREIRGKTRVGCWVEFSDTVPEDVILYFALRWS